MQAHRVTAEHGRFAITRDAIRAVGDARPAGAAHDPLATTRDLLGLNTREQGPLEGALPALRGCLRRVRLTGETCAAWTIAFLLFAKTVRPDGGLPNSHLRLSYTV